MTSIYLIYIRECSGRTVRMDSFLFFLNETNERQIYLEKSCRQRPKMVNEFKYCGGGWVIRIFQFEWAIHSKRNEERTISNKDVFVIVHRNQGDLIARVFDSILVGGQGPIKSISISSANSMKTFWFDDDIVPLMSPGHDVKSIKN